MTTNKTTMPEPVVEVDKHIVSSELQYTYLAPSGGLEHGTELITTDQAESYANARVREALEEAANIANRYVGTDEITNAIRALIPTTKAADCAVAKARGAQQWQPIETSPKDVFLLLCGPSGYTTTPLVFTTGCMCSDYHAGRWIDHANDDLSDWGFVPTHWMPLPAAPSPADEDARHD